MVKRWLILCNCLFVICDDKYYVIVYLIYVWFLEYVIEYENLINLRDLI